jgi:hypothetical protein
MKSLKKILFGCFALTALMFVQSCDDSDNDGGSSSGTSRVRINMTDAPGDYDEVNIEVVGVKYKTTTDTGEEGWIDLDGVEPGVYNLLDLTGGVTVLLADDEIPSGNLGQIRLILGDDNTVVKDGVTYPLNTPSAQQSGLKLKIDEELDPDVTYNFLVDFDVHHSVVEAGNSGNYNLHPVLRVSAEAASGSIAGHVTNLIPITASVMVGDVEVTADADANGDFVLHGIPAGTYTVTLNADPSLALPPVVIENVVVVNGDVTDVGDITL